MNLTVNQAAFGTTTLLAVGTIASCVLAATVASTVATVAFAALGIILTAVSTASITAWFHKDSVDPESYFNKMYEHIGVAIPATFEFVAKTLVVALVEGIGKGIKNLIAEKITGKKA